MTEVKMPKKSDGQKKKKTDKRSRRNKGACVRHRDYRPDVVKKIRHAIKSQGYESAYKLYEYLVKKEPEPGLAPIRACQKLLKEAKEKQS